MAYILAIETTTKNCSVALFDDAKQLALKELVSEGYSHAEQLTIFIEEVLSEVKISINNLNAIALSMGPGSYTGLRIGTSTAKGLCYSLGIPLIAISTLKAMALGVSENQEYDFYCPMIDARRMEVFAAIFDDENNQVRDIMADVVDANIYKEYLDKKVLFFGDGALKCADIISNENANFIEYYPSAKDIRTLAFQKYSNNDFEDVAYFEPFYLKDFVAGKKKS
jgi:tRNA threonylcarbamoyladenosine biosynthesis protein TsaB